MQHRLVNWQEAAAKIRAGEVVVVPTDTLYGVVGSALRPEVVNRVYALRKRELDKPLITLVSGVGDLARMGIELDGRTHELLGRVWPGPVSAVVPVMLKELQYIHRGTNSIAFRMPAKPDLLELMREVGPLVAPSANLAGEAPALSVADAYGYFGDEVNYLDEGPLAGAASALVDVRGTHPRVLRPAPGFNVSRLA